jgi:hypothetical protein
MDERMVLEEKLLRHEGSIPLMDFPAWRRADEGTNVEVRLDHLAIVHTKVYTVGASPFFP